MTALGFALAAALGGVVRWQSSRLNRTEFPIGTLGVNLVAAFIAGLAANISATASLILVTAFLGSMSTFSTVAGEIVDLRHQHGVARAAGYGAATITGGVAAAWLGLGVAP